MNAIKDLTNGIKDLQFEKLEDALDRSHVHLKQWEGTKEGICPSHTLGRCTVEWCNAMYLHYNETPPM